MCGAAHRTARTSENRVGFGAIGPMRPEFVTFSGLRGGGMD